MWKKSFKREMTKLVTPSKATWRAIQARFKNIGLLRKTHPAQAERLFVKSVKQIERIRPPTIGTGKYIRRKLR